MKTATRLIASLQASGEPLPTPNPASPPRATAPVHPHQHGGWPSDAHTCRSVRFRRSLGSLGPPAAREPLWSGPPSRDAENQSKLSALSTRQPSPPPRRAARAPGFEGGSCNWPGGVLAARAASTGCCEEHRGGPGRGAPRPRPCAAAPGSPPPVPWRSPCTLWARVGPVCRTGVAGGWCRGAFGHRRHRVGSATVPRSAPRWVKDGPSRLLCTKSKVTHILVQSYLKRPDL